MVISGIEIKTNTHTLVQTVRKVAVQSSTMNIRIEYNIQLEGTKF